MVRGRKIPLPTPRVGEILNASGLGWQARWSRKKGPALRFLDWSVAHALNTVRRVSWLQRQQLATCGHNSDLKHIWLGPQSAVCLFDF